MKTLPTDIEKRFEEEFGEEAQSSSMLDLHDFYEGGIYEDIKTFLATVLEEQKQAILAEVEGWLVENKKNTETGNNCVEPEYYIKSGWLDRDNGYNNALQDVMKLLKTLRDKN